MKSFLQEENNSSEKYVKAIAEIGRKMTSGEGLIPILQSIVDKAVEFLGARSGGLYLYDDEMNILYWTVCKGEGLAALCTTLKPNEGLAGNVLVTGKPRIINNYHEWEGKSEKWEKFKGGAVLCVPFSWKEKVLGILCVEAEIDHEFPKNYEELLEIFAYQAALATRYTGLITDTALRLEDLEIAHKIAIAIAGSLELHDLLEIVYREIKAILKPDAFFIALYSKESDQLEFKIFEDQGVRSEPFSRKLGEGLTSKVLYEKKALLIKNYDEEKDSRSLPKPIPLGTEKFPMTWLGIPICFGDRILGVISVQAYSLYAYDEDDQQLLCTIGEQVAVALENSYLHEEIIHREKKYREMLDGMPDPVVAYDKEGKTVYVNPAFTNVFGWTSIDVLGKKMDFYVPQEYMEQAKDMVRIALSGGINSGIETQRYSKDGRIIDVSISSALYSQPSQSPWHTVVTLRDMTERKRIEAQLNQAQKMEALGTLAGGIAHDFNNILSAIVGNAELAMMNISDTNSLSKNLELIKKSSKRAAELVKQILTFSRQKGEKQDLIQPGLCIKEATNFLRTTLPSTIELSINIKENLGLIKADPTQILQITMNLCTNSAYAMKEKGGLLEVQLNKIDMTVDEATQFSGLSAGPYIKLSVRDTGHGIEPEILKQIFEPYFTTKEIGEGTGLGLSVVYGIVKKYKGDIKVFSEPGKGSLFEVFLPQMENSTSDSQSEDSKLLPRGTERILIVDDEEDILYVIQTILESLGYLVTSTVSSIEALNTFKKNPDKFDAIISDMTMPHMTGTELSVRTREFRSDILFILCTGHSDLIDEEKLKELKIHSLLMKPIEMENLAWTIRRLLDQKK